MVHHFPIKKQAIKAQFPWHPPIKWIMAPLHGGFNSHIDLCDARERLRVWAPVGLWLINVDKPGFETHVEKCVLPR